MKKYIAIFFMLCPALLSARTWTAKDGRTISGDYVISTHEAVVVARDDGTTVTIPLNLLGDADVAYVRRASGQKTGRARKMPPFPKLCGPEDADGNDQQLEQKYEKLAWMLSFGASPRIIDKFKTELAKDAAYWRQEESYSSKPHGAPVKHSKARKSKSRAAAEAQNAALADRNASRIHARITWLTQTLPQWLKSAVKAAASPVE